MWLFLTAFLLTLVIMGYLISILVVRLLPKRPGESSPLSGGQRLTQMRLTQPVGARTEKDPDWSERLPIGTSGA